MNLVERRKKGGMLFYRSSGGPGKTADVGRSARGRNAPGSIKGKKDKSWPSTSTRRREGPTVTARGWSSRCGTAGEPAHCSGTCKRRKNALIIAGRGGKPRRPCIKEGSRTFPSGKKETSWEARSVEKRTFFPPRYEENQDQNKGKKEDPDAPLLFLPRKKENDFRANRGGGKVRQPPCGEGKKTSHSGKGERGRAWRMSKKKEKEVPLRRDGLNTLDELASLNQEKRIRCAKIELLSRGFELITKRKKERRGDSS